MAFLQTGGQKIFRARIQQNTVFFLKGAPENFEFTKHGFLSILHSSPRVELYPIKKNISNFCTPYNVQCSLYNVK